MTISIPYTKTKKQISQKLLLLFLILILACTSLSLALTNNKNINNIPGDDSTIVEKYGQLQVVGNQIVDKNGNAISLRGMSLFWSQWEGARFYNAGCVEWLRDDWECTVVRAAMGVELGGYLTNPVSEKNKVLAVIDAAINLGIYVIVDWHDHNAQNHQQEAKDFFAEIAEEYGDYPNLIYEIFNEPLQVSWTNIIKPYAEAVIDTIRSIDPDNLIIVGTPTWSQDVNIASQSPLEYSNIAYALHFYAATHKQSLRNKAITALNNGIALFVSEFGTCESNGSGFLDSVETDTWINFLESKNISWCNWSVVDKDETSAALKFGSGANSTGGWQESQLSKSGSLIRKKIKSFNNPTDIGDLTNELPLNFELEQNYPNPFNPETTIEFELNESGQIIMEIFDVNGSKIKTLVKGYKSNGKHKITWDGTSDKGLKVSSGVYYYHLLFENQSLYKKAVFLN